MTLSLKSRLDPDATTPMPRDRPRGEVVEHRIGSRVNEYHQRPLTFNLRSDP